MRFDQQGTAHTSYAVIPRCLIFITHQNDILLLRGAPSKRLWANKLNGVGGHIEPAEDPWHGAQREVAEETGLTINELDLRALIHISDAENGTGVLLFVFMTEAGTNQVRSGPEGELSWYPLDDLPWDEMVDDLPELLPRMLAADGIVYGVYRRGLTGKMAYSFHSTPTSESTSIGCMV